MAIFDGHGEGLVGWTEGWSLVEVVDECREDSSEIRDASGVGERPGIRRTFLAQCKRSGDGDRGIVAPSNNVKRF